MNEAQTRFNKIDPKLREMIRGTRRFVESLNLFIPNWRKIWKDL